VTVASLGPASSVATVATAGALLVQLTAGDLITRPAESRTVAVSMIVSPTATAAAAGDTCTEAGGAAATTTPADAVKPFTVAVTWYEPSANAVRSPVDETVRAFESLVAQVTG